MSLKTNPQSRGQISTAEMGGAPQIQEGDATKKPGEIAGLSL
jgi:hypothetical protein